MVPTDRHPDLSTQDSGFPNNARGEYGDWENASSVQPEEEEVGGEEVAHGNVKPEYYGQPDSEHEGNILAGSKVEHDFEPEPEIFDKIKISEEDCFHELGYSQCCQETVATVT